MVDEATKQEFSRRYGHRVTRATTVTEVRTWAAEFAASSGIVDELANTVISLAPVNPPGRIDPYSIAGGMRGRGGTGGGD